LSQQQRTSRPFMMRLPRRLEDRLEVYMRHHGLHNKSGIFRDALEALLVEDERRRPRARR
jgi:metal-responsive CopG/Arc/MetJ family transcriptional regulator